MVSIGPRSHAYPRSLPTSSSLGHTLETRTPEVLVPVALGPLARSVWLVILVLPRVSQVFGVLAAREWPFAGGVDGA